MGGVRLHVLRMHEVRKSTPTHVHCSCPCLSPLDALNQPSPFGMNKPCAPRVITSYGRINFYEYFHSDTGRGVGAAHQTGWPGLVAALIQEMYERDPVPVSE